MQTYSQELSPSQLDSLYNKFIQLRAPELLPQIDQPNEISLGDRKCGFGNFSVIRLNLDFFSPAQQEVLKEILQRPPKQTSIVSPSGIFRIHFDTTGSQTPRYNPTLTIMQNVEQVARAADSVYNFEVNYLGYPQPPSDNGGGGDNLYDIYISTARGSYGVTEAETDLGNEKYTSFIEIHYSFANFYTKGLAAMRVTVAHEFHHAIQMGSYVLRLDDQFFYELTSTSMEEFVFDDVNDYYAYLDNYFDNPAKPFTRFDNFTFDGYDLAIWNIYLQKNYDFDIIRRQWELMIYQRAILAIQNSMVEMGTTFPKEYNRFGIWTYFTSYRAIPNAYFEEAVNYPSINPLSTVSFPQYSTSTVDANVTSNNFINFHNTVNNDTLLAIVTNGDVFAAFENQNQSFEFNYKLYTNSLTGLRRLTDDYSSDFTAENPNWWSVSEILNGIVVREDSAIIPSPNPGKSFLFPNPFRYSGIISISVEAKLGEALDFNVYSIGLKLVYAAQLTASPLINNTIGVKWDGKDYSGNKLASGVYIYVIKKGSEVVNGKVVIFNE